MNAHMIIEAERLTLRKAAAGLLHVMAKKYPDAMVRLRNPRIAKAEYCNGLYIDIGHIYHATAF